MKASKAKSKKDGSELHTVTFRLSAEQRQKLIDYALALGGTLRRHVSNNEAIQDVLENLKMPKAPRATKPKNGATQAASSQG